MGPKIWVGSDDLFARPSFLSGVARALDLGGIFDGYNQSQSDEGADLRALEGDWAAVGIDMHRAIDTNR